EQGNGWRKGPAMGIGEHCWVERPEADCRAERRLCTIPGSHFPGGQYTSFYVGDGLMAYWGIAPGIARDPGKSRIDVDASRGGFFLRLKATNPDNPVKKIRVIMPGFAETYKTNPWHPAFLKRWQGMAVIRFMDFMATNNSQVSRWS